MCLLRLIRKLELLLKISTKGKEVMLLLLTLRAWKRLMLRSMERNQLIKKPLRLLLIKKSLPLLLIKK
jgi:hypothetical protein